MYRMLKTALSKLSILTIVVGLAYTGSAGAFELGDVLGSIGNGQVVRLNKNLQLIETIGTGHAGETDGLTFDEDGNLYVTNFNAGNITRFDGTGTILNPNPFVKTDSGNESIVFDSEGNFYVGVADGSHDIFKFNSEGTLLDRFDVARERRGSDWIDLAEDQKTIFYTSEGRRIFRYDVSTKTQLPDFAVLPAGGGIAFALRLLPNGGVLVADAINIKKLNAKGNIVQTYDIAGQDYWFALNLDPDGTSFWSGDRKTRTLARFNIETGEVMATVVTSGAVLAGVTVYGELTVARPAPLAITSKEDNWMEGIMDTTTLLATYALLAFLVERLTNGLALLMGYWKWWRFHFEVTATVDHARRGEIDRNRRVALFVLSAVVAVAGAMLAQLNLLPQIKLEGVPPIAGQILTGLLIASGADPIREIIQRRELRRDEPTPITPLQVSGTLVLQQSVPVAREKVEPDQNDSS